MAVLGCFCVVSGGFFALFAIGSLVFASLVCVLIALGFAVDLCFVWCWFWVLLFAGGLVILVVNAIGVYGWYCGCMSGGALVARCVGVVCLV